MQLLIRVLVAIALCACLNQSMVADEANLKEFLISASFPTGDDWQVLLDGPVKNKAGTYAYAVAKPHEKKQLTLMALPTAKGEEKTLQAKYDALQRGSLKKATRKISSGETSISGHPARKVVAALKLIDGSEVQVVTIFVIANGLTYSIGAVTKEPVESDADVKKFVESVRITDRK